MPNESVKLYLDGDSRGKLALESLTVVADRHDLLAVEVKKGSGDGDAFFLASSSNGVRTDKWWRCTNVHHDGWFLPSYNDSTWSRAYFVKNNTGAPHIAPDAKWIGYVTGKSKKIFCRRNTTFGKEI